MVLTKYPRVPTQVDHIHVVDVVPPKPLGPDQSDFERRVTSPVVDLRDGDAVRALVRPANNHYAAMLCAAARWPLKRAPNSFFLCC